MLGYHRLFCKFSVCVHLLQGLLSQADEDQVRMMEERVILVDWNDKAIGSGSKKETHIMASINEGLLHRAFSVFLFTPEGKLILQQVSCLWRWRSNHDVPFLLLSIQGSLLAARADAACNHSAVESRHGALHS